MKLDKLKRELVIFFVIVGPVSLQTLLEGWGADAQGVDSHYTRFSWHLGWDPSLSTRKW